MRAAIYYRVSTEDQVTDGNGLDIQQEKCRAQAVVKQWKVTHEFSDPGLSGTLEAKNRPGLQALLDGACAREFDAVIVASLDRLARDTRIALNTLERIENCGIEFVSCRESWDTSTPAGKFVRTMFAALAELDHGNIVMRLQDGRKARSKIDGEEGRHTPYGYRRIKINGHKSTIEINPEQAEIVKLIFLRRALKSSKRAEDRKQGAYQGIADYLNSQGVPGPTGGVWHKSSVSRIVQTENAYRGDYRGLSKVRWPVVLD